MSEKRFKGIKILGKKSNEIFIKDKEKDYYIRTEDEVVELLNEQQATISALKEENEQLRKENTALDNENAEHLADNIRELDLLEKLTKFLHECGLTDEQRALFREMITEEDLQPKLEHQTWKWKNE